MEKIKELVRGTHFLLPTKKFAGDYRRDAKTALKGRWGIAILAAFIFMAFTGGVSFTANLGPSSFYEEELPADATGEEATEEILDAELRADVIEILKSPSFWVGISLIVGVSMLFALLVLALIVGPVTVGYHRFNVDLFTGKVAKVETLFAFFKNGHYGKSVRLYVRYSIVMAIYMLPMLIGGVASVGATLGAWLAVGSSAEKWIGTLQVVSVVCVVLGFLGAIFYLVSLYKYHMSFMIMADHPELSPREAMKASKKLMKGNKWSLFCMHLSFIGWIFLGILSCGIGLIWVMPWMSAADAAFYRNISIRRKFGMH